MNYCREIAVMGTNNIKKILKILSDGHWHSGVVLAETLKITRAAVWKLVGQLKVWGVQIEAKNSCGYRINGGLELLDMKKIKSYLPKLHHSLLQQAIIFDVLPSTNTYLLDRARQNDHQTSICLAESQTMGRGRFGRHWFSPFGRNIYLSVLCSFSFNFSRLSGLSLVIAVAFLRTLKAMNIDADIGLKWPNDVQWQGKKLAGILIDLHGESHYSCDAVIGIGVNLDQPYELKQAAGVAMTDIAEIIHAKPARNQLIACLLASLFDAIDEFKKTGLASFFDEWVAHDVALNQPVNLVFGEKIIHGIYRGIDPLRGELLLQDEQGVIQQYSGGEVSLRINRI